MNVMGTFFIWFSVLVFYLTATTLVAAIQTFVAGAAAHHDVAAYITGRGITLHVLICRIHSFHATVCFHRLRCPLILYGLWCCAS